nr:sarcoplasmic reticulum histidine-rich calcium-binding protein-like [Chelonoidis abingdonii]
MAPPTAWLLLGLLCTLQPPGVRGNHRHGDVEPLQQAQGQLHHHDDPGPGHGEPQGQPHHHGEKEQPHSRHGDVARPQQAEGQLPPEAPGHHHYHGDVEPHGQPLFHSDRHYHHGDEEAQPHEAEDAPGPRRHDDKEEDAPRRRHHDAEEDEDEDRWRPQPEEEEEEDEDGHTGHNEESDESKEEGDESRERVLRKPHGAEERWGRAHQGEVDDEEEEEEEEEDDGYQPGSVCQYCAFCKHCGECEKCPCKAGDTSEHCESCQYCQFCYVCPLLCETGCQPGGIMDQLSGALVQFVSSSSNKDSERLGGKNFFGVGRTWLSDP